MELISQIDIARSGKQCSIQLLHGDLAALPAAHKCDILIMSAFPDEYIALEGSLILALEQKGLSVAALAKKKETDLRQQLNCWLSKPISKKQQAVFNFKRILCFEPGEKINMPETAVGNIFRCINTFVFDKKNNVVAMPLIGTGYQGVAVKKMLPELLKAALFWLQHGLPLDCIKLVVFNTGEVKEAAAIFDNFNKPDSNNAAGTMPGSGSNKPKLPQAKPVRKPPIAAAPQYDYFLSYAHKHSKEVAYFVAQLKKANKGLVLFYDRDTIPAGGMWIQMISSAIENAKKVLVFLSPEYDKSPVCWDEFQCAKLMEYNKRQSIIQTIYLFDHKETSMPVMMGIYSYIDCREGDTQKLRESIKQLLG